ncbi:glycosyltransferase [Thermosipho sp. 1074]|uniref:glycosyltransferase n=1 Tax=Thermosipho sp. 1074 TaxID=1643331 RepID=UPI000986D2F7|nr:glycosyltransferase [Thermosipho sp. 1074]OOC44216.1 glycosyl transferase family 1 [Thermosipho sp. 1074]
MKVCIASLKFSPAHYSHILAYSKGFSELGNDVYLLLDENYKKIVINDSVTNKIWYSKKNRISERFDLVLFHNVSVVNHVVSRKLKIKGSKIAYVYHEPWEGFYNRLKNEGKMRAIKSTLAHFFSVRMLRLSDIVIVPSNYALELYEKHDKKFNGSVVKIPLLFDDEFNKEIIDISKKKYFSYIGHAVKGHAFDKYLEFIKFLYKSKANLKFEIATRTDLSKWIYKDKILQLMIADGSLKISHGRPLRNQEINKAFERSFCVWNLYRRSTQSGVLPKAFMFGTPVIASYIGSFPEYVESGFNGEFVFQINNFEEVYEKLEKIRVGLYGYSQNARSTFFKTFYYKANIKMLSNIV